jgi:cell division protein DivIC
MLALAALVVGYFVFSAVGDTLLSRDLNQQEQALRDEIDTLEGQRSDLEAIRDYLRTDEYIEAVARRVLGLVRQGETLFIVSSSTPPAPTPDHPETIEPDERLWWEQLFEP